jgi:hypothetical protein
MWYIRVRTHEERKRSDVQPNLDLSLDLIDSRLIAAAVVGLARMLSTSDRLITHVPVLSQVLKSAALGLRDEKGGKDTREHEGGEDLHNVVEPWAGVGLCNVATGSERRDGSLGDNGTDLAGTCGDTVRGGTVASGETLSRNNEGGSVGAPVEEQLDEDVDAQHGVRAEVLECETLIMKLALVAHR